MSKWWRRTYSFDTSYKMRLLGHVQYGAKGTAIIEQPSFFILVSGGLSDPLLYSVFNALHLQTIIASIEGVPG